MRGLRRPGGRLAARAGAAAVLGLCAALAPGCEDPASTPRGAWSVIRAGIAARDGRVLATMYDVDTLVHRRQVVLDWRALLARGDAPENVLRNVRLTAEDVTAGSVDDAVARLFATHSPLVREGDWLRDAEVVSEEPEGPDSCLLVLRSRDGREKRFWMLRENGRWVMDHHRTWKHPK